MPVNREDSPAWEPPSYATPLATQDNNDEEWTPPSYATPVKTNEKPKPNILSRAYQGEKDALVAAKDFVKGKLSSQPDYGSRADGTKKGNGFLGSFKLPSGNVASEYSIADSEKLKDKKGNYLDYPSLVPTLTKEEVQQTLDAAHKGIPPPDSVKTKAEAFALDRQKQGKPFFAQPGEENTSIHPDLERVQNESAVRRFGRGLTDIPRSMYEHVNETGKKGAEQIKAGDYPGALDTVAGFITEPFKKIPELLANHPKVSQREAKVQGINQVLSGIGLPGEEVQQAIKDKDYARLFGQGVSAAAMFALPHAAGIHSGGDDNFGGGGGGNGGSELLIRRPKDFIPKAEEVPYKFAGELPNVEAPPSVRQKVSNFIKQNPDAKMDEVSKFIESVKPNEAAPIKKAEPFVNPFEKAKPEPTRSPNLSSEFSQDIPEETKLPEGRSQEDIIYDLAKDKVTRDNEAERLKRSPVQEETKPLTDEQILAGETTSDKPYSAVYRHYDPNLKEHQFDIVGGPDNGYKGSTRSAEGLKKLGIEVPPIPENANANEGLTGDQLRAKAIAERSGQEWTPPDYAKPIEGEVVNEDLEKGKELGRSLARLSGEPTSHGPTNEYFNQNKYDLKYSSDAQDAAAKSKGRAFRNWAKNKEEAAKSTEETKISNNPDDITELHRGLGGVGGGDKNYPPSEGPTGPVLDKLFNALGEAGILSKEQEAINKTERARRFAAFAGVKEEGVAGAAKSLGKLKGEFDKVNPGERLQLKQEETNSLFTAVKRANITEGEKARGYTALFKLLNGDAVPQRNELTILGDVFGNDFANRITELHGGIGAVGLKISKLANTMKSMQNSLSLAAPLRHGAGLIYRKEFYPAFRDMFKFFGNKEYFNSSMQAIQEHPNFPLFKESGGFFAKSGNLLSSEEEFLNSYVGDIPKLTGIPQTVAASQRGYTGFLNKLRFDTFNNMIKTMKALGHETHTTVGEGNEAQIIPSKGAKAIARYINNATGRGDLPFGLNKMTNELNTLLWSPRMMASRINMFANPKIYIDLPKGMRLEGVKSLLGMASMSTVINTLGVLGGAKVSTNILSSDFLKSRFPGNKVVDPNAGLQQFVVAGARFLAGKTDTPTPTTRLQIAGRFLANKESPAASLAHSILTAKKFTGKTADNPMSGGDYTDEYGVKTSVQAETLKRFEPIFSQDIRDLIASEPDFANNIGLDTAMGVASLAGMSQEYAEPKQKGKLSIGKMKLR